MVNEHPCILYFSNHCKYSQYVVKAVFENDLNSRFTGVCVDDDPTEIPSFIKYVPSIFTPDRQVLLHEQVMEFVNNMIAPKQEEDGGLLGFAPRASFSDAYAVLDTCAESFDDDTPFGVLGDDISAGSMPPKHLGAKSQNPAPMQEERRPRIDGAAVEKFMAERDSAVRSVLEKQKRGI